LIGGAVVFIYYMENSSGEQEPVCPRAESDYSTTASSSREILAQINLLRNESGLPPVAFDEHLYLLAEKRVDDMTQYNYYAYTNPYTGKCINDIKGTLGFGSSNIRESIEGLQGLDYNNPCIKWEKGNWHDVLSFWMDGGNNQANLMYEWHTEGAVACKFDKCVFLGLNDRGYETKCY